ncbi:MAG: hypothetical protein P8Y70_04470 [Candidatus Lokiarchaeota archaeon]
MKGKLFSHIFYIGTIIILFLYIANPPLIFNSFGSSESFYFGFFNNDGSDLLCKASSEGNDDQPYLFGTYERSVERTGEYDLGFNISHYCELINCVLEYNYSLNGQFEGPFYSNMDFVNKTYFRGLYYSYWFSNLTLPNLSTYQEYTFVFYRGLSVTDINGSVYKIYISPRTVTNPLRSTSFQINFIVIPLFFIILLTLIGLIIVIFNKEKFKLFKSSNLMAFN